VLELREVNADLIIMRQRHFGKKNDMIDIELILIHTFVTKSCRDQPVNSK
jgi:hypothetical protein